MPKNETVFVIKALAYAKSFSTMDEKLLKTIISVFVFCIIPPIEQNLTTGKLLLFIT